MRERERSGSEERELERGWGLERGQRVDRREAWSRVLRTEGSGAKRQRSAGECDSSEDSGFEWCDVVRLV